MAQYEYNMLVGSVKRASLPISNVTTRTPKYELTFNAHTIPPTFEGTYPKLQGIQHSIASCEHEKIHNQEIAMKIVGLSFFNLKAEHICVCVCVCVCVHTIAYLMLE